MAITRPTAAASAVIALVLASATAAAGRPSARAHTSRVLKTTDTAKLHYIPPAHGALLFEEGTATGTLPGRMRASVDIGATTSGSFTIYTRYGEIKGHGSASMHGSGLYQSFAGTLVATGGTGRYAHARGHAGLYGTFDRRTYALVVQTTGSLSY